MSRALISICLWNKALKVQVRPTFRREWEAARFVHCARSLGQKRGPAPCDPNNHFYWLNFYGNISTFVFRLDFLSHKEENYMSQLLVILWLKLLAACLLIYLTQCLCQRPIDYIILIKVFFYENMWYFRTTLNMLAWRFKNSVDQEFIWLFYKLHLWFRHTNSKVFFKPDFENKEAHLWSNIKVLVFLLYVLQ